MTTTARTIEVSDGTFLEIHAKLGGKRRNVIDELSLNGVVIKRRPYVPVTMETDGRRTSWTPERRVAHRVRMQQHAEMRKAMR